VSFVPARLSMLYKLKFEPVFWTDPLKRESYNVRQPL